MNKLIKPWGENKLIFGTTTKLMGAFTKFEDPKKFIEVSGIHIRKIVCAEQVHGNKVVTVSANDTGKNVKNADGLITNTENLCLIIYTADCIPAFFYEPKKGIVGLSHAGRMGSKANISGNTIKEMIKLGADVKNIRVHLGPHICKNCYEMDLANININQLISLKILRSNISVTDYCTYENDELFYSYSREKPKTKKFSEMISYISLK